MNYTTAVFLINDAVRCVEGIYESDTRPNVNGVVNPNPPRTRFKTLDPTIRPGDFVLVPTDTRHGMSVNKIMAVDLDVDFDSGVQMKWVIGKVDRSAYEAVLVQEADAIQVMRSAELRSKREKLRDSIIVDQKAKDAMLALPISTAAPADAPEKNVP